MTADRRERDEICWLIAREIPALRRYAHMLMRGGHRRDDLVQDTLERAIRKCHGWRREGSIRTWLYRIQYTVFLNHYCKPDGGGAPDGADGAAAPAQESGLELKRVMAAADRLERGQREVLMLVAVEGFTYDEAARIMDVPVGTVRSRLARARADLRTQMRGGGGAARKTGTGR